MSELSTLENQYDPEFLFAFKALSLEIVKQDLNLFLLGLLVAY